MSIHRRAARRDSNEVAIVAALEAAGATVVRLSAEGAPDLLIGFRNVVFLAEVKTKTGRLTPAQLAFHQRWQGRPVAIVCSPDDALRLIGVTT